EGQSLVDLFNYSISDNDPRGALTSSSAVEITLLGTNDAPVAVDDHGTVSEDGVLSASDNVLSNDSDIDQGTVLSVAAPGTFAGTYGTLTVAANGSYTYTLNNASFAVQSLGQGESVTDSFGYLAQDDATNPLTSAANVLITIDGANDAPVLVTPIADQSAREGQALSLDVPAGTFTDIDRNDALSYSATLADGSALPSWLTFDAATQHFGGTPAAGSAGTY